MSGPFDLSRNTSLRTLETTATSIVCMCAQGAASGFLRAVVSTIIPSLPLDVVITYCDEDFGFHLWTNWPFSTGYSPAPVIRMKKIEEGRARYHAKRFKVLREVHKVRSFRLVLCADVSGCVARYSVGVLKRLVETERERGGLDYLQCKLLIVSEVRAPHSRPLDRATGYTPIAAYIRASAL